MNIHHCRGSRLSTKKEPKKVQFSTIIHKSGYRSVKRTSSNPSSLERYIIHVHHFLEHRKIQKPIFYPENVLNTYNSNLLIVSISSSGSTFDTLSLCVSTASSGRSVQPEYPCHFKITPTVTQYNTIEMSTQSFRNLYQCQVSPDLAR